MNLAESTVDINIVYNFNLAGMRLIFINGRYYTVDFFEAATPTILKHKLVGKDVTQIISVQSQLANVNIDTQKMASVIMQFDDIKKRTMEFHKDIPFILYA